MLNHLRCVLIFTLVISFVYLMPARPAQADGCFGLTSLGATYTQNFDTLATSGTSTTTPVGWNFSESGTNANTSYTAGTGSSNTGDTYSFGTTSNNERAFGGLRSGTLIPVIGACFTNNTGATINSLRIVYTGEEWRFGATGRTDQLDFQYSVNSISLTTGTWTDVNSLDFITPNTSGTAGARDGNDPANRAVPSATITGLSIANGANFWLRWNDLDATSNDDGLALDNFSLTPLATSATVSASKTDALATDTDGDTQADPGDVLSYTIIISNSGGTATGLTVSDTLDANTSQNGLVGVSPVAFDDSYNASANPATLPISDGPSDLLANDYPGLNPAVTGLASFGGGSLTGDASTNATGSVVTFGTGGSLTVNANGSFNFSSPAGYQGVFGFFYRLQNSLGPSDGLVTITVDAPPTVNSTSPTNGATNVNATSNITLNFSESVNIAAGGITLTCDASPVSFTPALPQNGASALVLDPTVNLPGNATCTVTILAANTTDTDTNDPPNNLDGNGDGLEGDNYSFSFQVAPTANDDSYNVTPHLTLDSTGTATTTVRANDDPITVTITGFGFAPSCSGTTPGNQLDAGAANGRLTLNPNGTFTYEPPAGVSNATRTFCYTITGGDTANIVFTLQNTELVWFVDAAAAAGGVGNQARPFQTITAAAGVDTSGDTIFVRYNAAGYSCGVSLLTNERLIGEGSGSTLAALSGVTPVAGSTFPALTNNSANWPNLTAATHCLTLATDNTLRGFNFGNVGAANTVITGTTFSTLTVNDAAIATNGRALNLNNGTAAATFNSISSAGSGTTGVSFSNVAGSFTVSTLTITNSADRAIEIAGCTGTLSLGVVNINTTGGTAFFINGSSPTVQATSVTITNSSSRGLLVQSLAAAGSVTIGSVNISASAAEGIASSSNAASITINGGSLQTNGGGAEFYVSGGSGNITYAGTITDVSPDPVVYIENSTSGTKIFSGAISGGGIGLVNNTGATINFSGGVTLSSGSSTGFSASGGGTVSVTGANNTIATTTGIALNVANTTIGASGLTFRSISANGGTNGIMLNTTGASGGLTVTGTGTTDGSGGTIQNTTNRGASFISASNITLRNMNFTNAGTSDLDADNSGLSTGDNLATNAAIHLQSVTTVTLDNLNISGGAEQGINGNSVANFILNNSSISNVGNGPDEDNIHFFNMSGASAITNTALTQTTGDDNLNLQTQSGTLALNISGGSASGGGTQQGSGYLFGIRGTTNATITFANANSSNNFSGGIVADAFDNATMNLTVTGSTSSSNNDQLSVSAGDNSQVNLDASGNSLSSPNTADFVAVSLLGSAFDNGFVFDARLNSNTITTGNGRTADGISVFNAGGGAMNIAITNNTIDYAGTQRAILVQAGQDGSGANNVTITGNTLDIELDGTGNAAAGMLAQSAITGPGNTSSLCVDIGGAGTLSNTFTHSLGGSMAGGDIRVRQRLDGTVRLPGYSGTSSDTTAVSNYLNGRNTIVSSSTATVDTSTGNFTGFGGGTACTQPTIP